MFFIKKIVWKTKIVAKIRVIYNKGGIKGRIRILDKRYFKMNPKQFLMTGGVVLVVVGLAGMFNIIGPTPETSLLGENWWLDNAENWAHLVLGAVALVVAYALPASLQAVITLLVGIVGVLVALWGWVIGPDFYGANLENPLDNILHLAVGVWALWAWWNGRKMM